MPQTTSFWDRRRAAVLAEAEVIAEARATPPSEPALDSGTDEEILTRLNLPDPDSLSAGDDFSAFMADVVPARIRTRALRRLWRSNPVLACVDGLNDYDGDYVRGSTGNGVIATGYQVGKGMLAHIQEIARQADAAAAIPPETNAAPAPAPVRLPEPPEVLAAAPKPEPASDTDTGFAATDSTDAPAAPRRMRFHFDNGASA